jgi:hypothetical protein
VSDEVMFWKCRACPSGLIRGARTGDKAKILIGGDI